MLVFLLIINCLTNFYCLYLSYKNFRMQKKCLKLLKDKNAADVRFRNAVVNFFNSVKK
jgi:hypothetical protein